MRTLRHHWPEYVAEASALALFMISATACAVLLQWPGSPLAAWAPSPLAARVPMGAAMGLTAAVLIYSPLGRRSGAHMNPAVTLSFLRLGRISRPDAVGYVLAQFIGAVAGVALTIPLFRGLPADPSVHFVATMPGPAGPTFAFIAETSISFVLMATVLTVSHIPRLAPFTGLAAAALVAGFIVVEAPLSGMSMNPARSFGSALFAHSPGLWIYFTAPLLGMGAAAEVFRRLARRVPARCAKLHHAREIPCIHCHYLETAA